MAARTRQLDRTRAAIVEATMALFSAQGCAATTVEQIADAAGVSRRTFFRHFPAKEAVLFHDFEVYERATIDDLRRRLAHEPPFVALVGALRAAAEGVVSERSELLRRIAAETDHLMEHHRAVVMRHFEQQLVAIIAGALGAPAGSVAVVAGVGAILAAFSAAVNAWILSEPSGEFAQWLDAAFEGVLDAVASVASRPPTGVAVPSPT